MAVEVFEFNTYWFADGLPVYAQCRVLLDGSVVMAGSSNVRRHSKVGDFDYYAHTAKVTRGENGG